MGQFGSWCHWRWWWFVALARLSPKRQTALALALDELERNQKKENHLNTISKVMGSLVHVQLKTSLNYKKHICRVLSPTGLIDILLSYLILLSLRSHQKNSKCQNIPTRTHKFKKGNSWKDQHLFFSLVISLSKSMIENVTTNISQIYYCCLHFSLCNKDYSFLITKKREYKWISVIEKFVTHPRKSYL